MPLFYMVIAILGAIGRMLGLAFQEAELRQQEQLEADYFERAWRRQREAYEREAREIHDAGIGRDQLGSPPQGANPGLPHTVDTQYGPARRFTLRIPLADNQIAVALRTVRAEAQSLYSGIAGLRFASHPGGTAVDVTIEETSRGAVDPVAVKDVFERVDAALRDGWKF